MLCPRCHRARIERDGVVDRCAVCGMCYDPNRITTDSGQRSAALVSAWSGQFRLRKAALPRIRVH